MTQLGESVAVGMLAPAADPDGQGLQPFDEAFQFVDASGEPIPHVRYEIIKTNGGRVSGVADDKGRVPRLHDPNPLGVKVRFLGIAKP